MTDLTQDLVSLFDEDVQTQEVVVARARAYIDARKLSDDAEQIKKDAWERLLNAEMELLRAMDSAGVKSLKIEHNGVKAGLTQTASTYFSMPAGGLEDPGVIEWLEQSGGADIIKRTIHHSTFSSFCKELAEKSVELHPLVKVANRKGVQLRKG